MDKKDEKYPSADDEDEKGLEEGLDKVKDLISVEPNDKYIIIIIIDDNTKVPVPKLKEIPTNDDNIEV